MAHEKPLGRREQKFKVHRYDNVEEGPAAQDMTDTQGTVKWTNGAIARAVEEDLILILILIKISLTKFGRRPFMQNPGATLPAF